MLLSFNFLKLKRRGNIRCHFMYQFFDGFHKECNKHRRSFFPRCRCNILFKGMHNYIIFPLVRDSTDNNRYRCSLLFQFIHFHHQFFVFTIILCNKLFCKLHTFLLLILNCSQPVFCQFC